MALRATEPDENLRWFCGAALRAAAAFQAARYGLNARDRGFRGCDMIARCRINPLAAISLGSRPLLPLSPPALSLRPVRNK